MKAINTLNQPTTQTGELVTSLSHLSEAPVDVLVIGSGPAGTFFTKRLFERLDASASTRRVRIGVLERGGILTLGHINNLFPNGLRRRFIDRFKIQPWEGDFKLGGMLLPAVGGRGIASGAHLRRFDPVDFSLWPNGEWPGSTLERLSEYYDYMEHLRRVGQSGIRGPLQMWAAGRLNHLHPHTPPIGLDNWSGGGFEIGRGIDSPVFHLWSLLVNEHLNNPNNPRLTLVTKSISSAINFHGKEATEVICHEASSNGSSKVFRIKARRVVLAASTIESARILLNSRLNSELPAAGRFLAEHIERRSKIQIHFDPADTKYSQGVSLILPPPTSDLADRFQVHLRGEVTGPGVLTVDIGGFAAVDPNPDNCVTLSSCTDEFGIRKAHTHFCPGEGDMFRTDRMCDRILEVTELLKGTFITKEFPLENSKPKFIDKTRRVQVMDFGRSYHECGTLRMGKTPKASVTDANGRVHGCDNLWVADASLFPCVGVANPMLTIGALASFVADNVSSTL